jgi:hypothetical protein
MRELKYTVTRLDDKVTLTRGALWEPAKIIKPADSMAVRVFCETGFNYGYEGEGADQLALAILLDYLGTGRAASVLDMCQQFKRQILAGWQSDHHQITGDELAQFCVDYRRKAVAS